MFKKIGFIIVAIILIAIFLEPVRNYLNNLVIKGKKEIIEEHILGTISGYNSRTNEDGNVSPAEKKAKAPKPKLNEDTQDEIMTYRLKSKGRVREIQTALKNAGFDPGEIDGKMGTKTKSAIKEFQKMKGLPADGIVGTKTWDELKMYIPKEEMKGDKR